DERHASLDRKRGDLERAGGGCGTPSRRPPEAVAAARRADGDDRARVLRRRGCSRRARQASAEALMPPAERRVLFFGASLVAGVGDPAGLGWVGRVVAASFALDVPLTAYNLG